MKKLIIAILYIIVVSVIIDFVRFPECYITTWKYQLQQDIKAGKEDAIKYYNTTYLKPNRILFK